jgi:hypothetical protein
MKKKSRLAILITTTLFCFALLCSCSTDSKPADETKNKKDTIVKAEEDTSDVPCCSGKDTSKKCCEKTDSGKSTFCKRHKNW